MRHIALILAGTMLASCSTAPQPTMRSAQAQAQYTKLIDGKVAGAAVDCLPHFHSKDMVAIDDQTAVFRSVGNKVYVTHFAGSCTNLGEAGYALVTKQHGSPNMCRGDIAQMVQTTTGMTVGSCGIGSFVPYTTP